MNCKLYRTEIEETDFGVTPGDAALRHLRECAACREFYEERLALRRLVGGLGAIAAPADFEFRLRARMVAEKVTTRPVPAWRRFAPGTVSIALAACFALVVAAAALRFRSVETRPTASVSSSTGQIKETTAKNVLTETPAKVETNKTTRNKTRVDGGAFETAPRGSSDGMLEAKLNRRDLKTANVTFNRARATRAANEAAKALPDVNSNAGVVASANGGQLQTSDSAVRASRTLRLNEPVALPVNMSAQPLRVVLRDEQGASRVVAIRSVSFGAQELVGRSPSAPARVTQAREGVW